MTYCSITFCNCSLFGFDFFFLRFASTNTQVSLRVRNPGFDQYGGCILWFVVTRFLVCTKEQVLFTFPSLEHQWHSRIPESLIVWFVSGLRLLPRILVCLKSPLYKHNSFQTVRRADVSSTNPNMERGLLSVSSGTLLANFIIFVF